MTMAETAREMEARLLGVIARSAFEVLDGDFVWDALASGEAPAADGIACVRDGDRWHQLVPAATASAGERYRMVCFHFEEGTNATGFVAWLHRHVKEGAGTGAIVICGKDNRDTAALFQTCHGVFDYWGCPVAAGDKLVTVIRTLIDRGRALA